MKNTFKLATLSLALAAVMGAPMLSAMADDTLSSYQIYVKPESYLSKFPPAVIYTGEQDAVSFQVLNSTPRAIYYVHGDDKEYIPVSSQTTVFLRDIQEDGKYSLEDADGNVLVTGEVRTGTEAEYMASLQPPVTAAGDYSQLSKFTSNDYVTKTEEYRQEESTPRAESYREPSRTTNQPSQPVRGYW